MIGGGGLEIRSSLRRLLGIPIQRNEGSWYGAGVGAQDGERKFEIQQCRGVLMHSTPCCTIDNDLYGSYKLELSQF